MSTGTKTVLPEAGKTRTLRAQLPLPTAVKRLPLGLPLSESQSSSAQKGGLQVLHPCGTVSHQALQKGMVWDLTESDGVSQKAGLPPRERWRNSG